MEGDDDPRTLKWSLRVSGAEIRQAKRDWLAARDSDADVPNARVEMLFDYYRALIRIQAQQVADDFRSRHPLP